MPRALIISGLQIFPPQSGGQLRSAGVARRVVEAENDVYIHSLTGRKTDYLNGMRSGSVMVDRRIEEFVDRSRLFGVLQFLSYRLMLPPFWLTFFGRFLISARLKREIEAADQVIIDQPFLYPCLAGLKVRTVVNTHNIEHHLWRGSWFARTFIAPLVKRIEMRAVRRCDETWCCSEQEKLILLQMGARSVKVVPNFVPPISRSKEIGEALRTELKLSGSSKVILFSASQYGPNVEAFRFLSEFALANEDLLEELNAYLLVVGSVSASPHREGRIVVTGPVAEVAPFFSVADLAINPVIAGSGTSLKMYEYQAAGIPILSTSFGARGLGMVEGIDFKPFRREELREVLQRELGSC